MNNESSSHSKGQIFSTDALLALIVFTLLLGLTLSLYGQIQNTGENAKRTAARSIVAEQVLGQLLSSPGNPRDWENYSDRNYVKWIGLIDHEGGISSAKWTSLRDWNTTDATSLKNWLGIADMNFYLSMSDANHSTLLSIGVAPSDINKVSVLTLPSLYNNHPVWVQLQVFQR